MNHAAKQRLAYRQLGMEQLEHRRVLATNLGEITGTVLNDLQNDGNTANDVVQVGLPVSLFRDGNANGTFDGAGTDAQVGATINTDANGVYRFTGLTEGTYFVQITPGSELQVLAGGDLQTVVFDATEAMGVTALTIDDFSTAQTVSVSRLVSDVGTTDNSDADTANANDGGVRDLYVEATTTGNVSLTSQFGGSNVLSLESSSGTEGIARVTWDGTDGDGDAVDPDNLALDFSDSGANFGVLLRVSADNKPDAEITVRLTSGTGNVGEATVSILDQDGLFDGDDDEEIVVPFDDFIENVQGTGVDFDNITAIELELDFRSASVSGLDARVELVGVAGNTVKPADFSVLNRMSLGDRVFGDVNNDGLFSGGELGIEGVTVSLFEDTDSSGDYTDGVDQALALTDTTDANGFYLFEDLVPGDYIVRVDQTNLDSGVLVGLATSTGNDTGGMAPDPDDPGDGAVDLNSDDNGTQIGALGVFSKAITLIGDDEPTNDGDSDANSNLTVDFGFFGYDLTIDKQVSSATTAPDGQLTYTIIVTNNGPSTSGVVSFTDTLPGEVTFSSGSTNVGDNSVTHNAGTVTADLGTLAPDGTATVTIIVDVNNNAVGPLTNQASVSAPGESNLNNNSDDAVTTITPQIDLVLDKSDDDNDQQIAPGSDLVYTIVVDNNGPSTATGVVLTDTLPTGVTFNAAASNPQPTTNSNGVLTYNLADIVSGGDTTILIGVTVDDDFAGTLTNTAVVAANEDETDDTNNDGMAQSVVAVELASIAGNVYVDSDNDGVFDADETPIAGVTITLTGMDFTGGNVMMTTTTAADGSYLFSNLLPGTYRVQETQPAFFGDGQDTAGSEGGDVTDDDIQNIVLQGGDNSVANNFGELAPTLTKRRFLASSL